MSLFKFQNYSAIKIAQDNPRVLAVADMKNGYVFKIEDNVDGTEQAAVFDDATDAKGEQVYIMNNIIDKPEIQNSDDYKIESGEYARAFNLNKVIDEKVEMSSDLVIDAYASISVGDILIPCNEDDDNANELYLWKIADAYDTGYGVCLKVTKKTTFGTFTVDGTGGGLECKVTSN